LLKNIRTRAQRITAFFFLMFPYFCVLFAMYFPFICSLNELKYLYVFVTRCFIHTVNFPVEKFIHCYLLALGQSSHWRGVILSMQLCEFFGLLVLESAPPCPYCPYVCLPTKCFLYNKNIYCVTVFMLCTCEV